MFFLSCLSLFVLLVLRIESFNLLETLRGHKEAKLLLDGNGVLIAYVIPKITLGQECWSTYDAEESWILKDRESIDWGPKMMLAPLDATMLWEYPQAEIAPVYFVSILSCRGSGSLFWFRNALKKSYSGASCRLCILHLLLNKFGEFWSMFIPTIFYLLICIGLAHVSV